MKKITVLSITVLIIFAAACKPVPETPHASSVQAWSEQDVDGKVIMEEVLIPSTAPLNPLNP
jgi:hypothetical protein